MTQTQSYPVDENRNFARESPATVKAPPAPTAHQQNHMSPAELAATQPQRR